MTNPAASFTSIADYYDLLMADVPYDMWMDHIERLWMREGIQPRTVLDLACGTGAMCERLNARGYSPFGIDLSEPMIQVARQKAAVRGLPIQYAVQDASSLAVDDSAFDAVISLFDSLNYLVDPRRFQAALDAVHRTLRAGGMFIFDLNTEYSFMQRMFDISDLRKNSSLRYRWESHYDPVERLCRVDMEFEVATQSGYERFSEVHFQRAYPEADVKAGLHSAGFENVQSFDGYTTLPASSTTERIFFVARA